MDTGIAWTNPISNQLRLRIATAVVAVESSSEQVVGVTAEACELRTDCIFKF